MQSLSFPSKKKYLLNFLSSAKSDSKQKNKKNYKIVKNKRIKVEAIGEVGTVSAKHQNSLSSHTNGKVLKIFSSDPCLAEHKAHLNFRFDLYTQTLRNIEEHEGGLEKFSTGHWHLGVHQEDKCSVFREWAPAAINAILIGDFNNWRGTWMTKDKSGIWTCKIPHGQGKNGIFHGSRLKVRLQHRGGWWVDVLPAYTTYAVQNKSKIDGAFDAVHWDLPEIEKYKWQFKRPDPIESLRIYEAHVGMSSREPKVASYTEFKDNVIPHIVSQGYNAIQLMAIQEHPYYASFGYHVSNIFAVSSRFGTPEELKSLIDKAHGSGLVVLLDIVHSHITKNAIDGLSGFDLGQGEVENYFHTGPRGYHKVWDSRLLNYKNWEVLRLLLSNLRWWLEEYKFDGFRFDGVTSMLYHHHGINFSFTGNYMEYFSTATDIDAAVYLMLANTLIHKLLPQAVTIAEDVSGMPGLCVPVADGGIGFDYRLAMGIPELWLRKLGNKRDETWSMTEIVKQLTNRHQNEKTVAYVECHDQSMVGGQSLAFRLMGTAMWNNMNLLEKASPLIERGIALHKMIRLLTLVLGGQSWLNFMGNEFGHPDWIDFPREGNGWSHDKCRRQWNLINTKDLRYSWLNNWDKAMMELDKKFKIIKSATCNVSMVSDKIQMIVVTRGPLLFVFNFSPHADHLDLKVSVPVVGNYEVVLDSDSVSFGGNGYIKKESKFTSNSLKHSISKESVIDPKFSDYMEVPSFHRTAVVYKLIDNIMS